MGCATRWLTNLLGGKKEGREHRETMALAAALAPSIDNKTEKKKWTYMSGRISCDLAWLRSLYAEKEKEDRKHAIAVAAATAAAATAAADEAAVAAAQAAVAVVRLTNRSRHVILCGIHEQLRALKIQQFPEAKKALRALKALVKLQAVVLGYIVRTRVAATLRCMEALMRAQATVRTKKFRTLPRKSRSYKPLRETFDEVWFRSPKIVEIDTYGLKSRSFRRTSLSDVDESFINSMSTPIPCCPGEMPRCSSTAQNTPRWLNSGLSLAPPSPTKSVRCFEWGIYSSDYCTLRIIVLVTCQVQSFDAKVRLRSGLKQRAEGHGLGKRDPLSELVVNLRNALMEKLSSSPEFNGGNEKRFYVK